MKHIASVMGALEKARLPCKLTVEGPVVWCAAIVDRTGQPRRFGNLRLTAVALDVPKAVRRLDLLCKRALKAVRLECTNRATAMLLQTRINDSVVDVEVA